MMNEDAVLYYADYPADFVEDILRAKPDPVQRDILNSVAKYPLTSVRSGHGIGKSAVESWAAIWFLCTRPFPKVPCTAPTQHQLYDILWAEISKWLRNNPALQSELVWTKERVYMKSRAEEWFAVARTASTPDALQGFHADHVLYIIDEASGVRDEIFEPILGALSTEGARLLMCGNPTKLTGFFFDSHHKHRSKYNTIHVDGRDSARVDKEFIDTIKEMYGEDSNVFRVRVKGDFPTAEDDVFIPLALIEASIVTEYTPRIKPTLIHIGCDVARYGDDKTVIGYRVDEKIEFYSKKNGQDTMTTAAKIVNLGKELVDKYKLERGADRPIAVKVDDGGVGGGVVDRLRQIRQSAPEEYWWLDIFPVHFGASIKHRYYTDSTTYMMSVVKSLLDPIGENGEHGKPEIILPDDNHLVAQLSCRKYKVDEKSKIKVESKEEMKKRKLPSPDEADCVLLCCLPVRQNPPKKK